ncbi:DegT/DnrJ/EryC1/StrS family aminotransferase [Vibrio coralliilyticus]|uniref:DegT/DnrJ/EryC1/StrS family aminotransferase n=1 Tax=Vibrio coralliilyticus TaxID=190893 RepID=UPI002FD411DB
MINEMILTAGPSITEKEINYVTDAVTNGWNDDWNKYLVKFEKSLADYVGVKHSISTSSCTGALHLSLMACGIGPGDEVIVPEITWVASASAVAYVGATPVFCDIDPVSWCMDIESAASLIGPKTKAIMPVHLYGHPANMPAIMKLARDNNLKVIEDAAPSIGAEIDGKKTGSFGDAAGFSFQGAKILSTGEGGMFVSNNDEVFQRVKSLNDHGRDPSRPLAAVEVGYKYKMSNLQAAMGLAQIERVEELVDRKRDINRIYRELLADCPGVKVTSELSGCKSIHWMTSVELLGYDYEKRQKFMNKLKENLVDSRPVFSPLSSLPMFERRVKNPVADRIGQSAINLPSGHNLTQEQLEHVAETIKSLV